MGGNQERGGAQVWSVMAGGSTNSRDKGRKAVTRALEILVSLVGKVNGS